MSQTLRLSLVQANLHWEDRDANLQRIDKLLEDIEGSDLILLPEMFTTAFSMNSAQLAEKMNGPTMQWMASKAKEKQAVICGSLIIEEGGKYFNRLIWMRPDGTYEVYDKRHLFRMADEEKHFAGGSKQLIVDLKGWRVCPLICYDLRFPVWSRRRPDLNYDLLLYVANWPSPRASAWEKLLYARAIENQSYVAGLNRVGEDGKGNGYIGKSMIIDAKGEALWQGKDQETAQTISLDKNELEQFRKKFPVGMDADEFEITSR